MQFCAHEETIQSDIGLLLQAFWEIQQVGHMKLPAHLEGTELSRLQGVYSKLQTLKIFDAPPNQFERVVLMDATW